MLWSMFACLDDIKRRKAKGPIVHIQPWRIGSLFLVLSSLILERCNSAIHPCKNLGSKMWLELLNV